MLFSDFGLNPKLLKAVEKLGFEEPTAIQGMAIPPLMEGRDIMAAATTGSGKTAAFLLPIMHRLMEQPRGITRILVLEPTREMAAQILEHMGQLGAYTALKGAAVYGGVGMSPQEQAFRRGFDIIAATPGRLLDHMQYSYAKLSGLEVIVLDEADRMLDMGFMPDIQRILKAIPAQRQTLLFSATMPEPIVDLAKKMLKNPAMIDIERKSAPAEGITHTAYPVNHELKSKLFMEILKRNDFKSVLAFTRTKHRANRLADFLERNGVPSARLHGGRSQAQRTEALHGFKRGKFRVLVATDVAARGIDVQALGLVVNFDVPGLPEDYIHRVGRTARIDAKGDAFTFVSPIEERDLHFIERHLGKRLPRQKVQGFDYSAKPEERFEVPIEERIAEIRARKAEDRNRAKAKAERRGFTSAPSGRSEDSSRPRRDFSSAPSGKPADSRGPRREFKADSSGKPADSHGPRRDFNSGRPDDSRAPKRDFKSDPPRKFDDSREPKRDIRPDSSEKPAEPRAQRRIPAGFSPLSEVFRDHLKPGVDPEYYEEKPRVAAGEKQGERPPKFSPRGKERKTFHQGDRPKRQFAPGDKPKSQGPSRVVGGKPGGQKDAPNASAPQAGGERTHENHRRSSGSAFRSHKSGPVPAHYPNTKRKRTHSDKPAQQQ
jgi:ATP-dependent RNA helicase RhlE